MIKAKYKIIYERDEENRIFVSYSEDIGGVTSSEPTEQFGRSFLEWYTEMVSELGPEVIFKDPSETILEIIEEIEI